MDAHLFRLFCASATPLLRGAAVEKIQEPEAGLLVFSLYSQGVKRQFVFHSGKISPFCFMAAERITANKPPTAQIMRLRRYFGQKRIGSVISQVWSRRLWLMAGIREEGAKIPWLCLDLAKGASLHFLEEGNLPREETVIWPSLKNLETALENWRDWPVLTPALRRTLLSLTPEDRGALLVDLEAGGGDIFLYADENDRISRVSAWPLSLVKKEEISEDILPALAKTGRDLVLLPFYGKGQTKARERLDRRRRQLEKVLTNLEKDAKKHRAALAKEKDALALQANLWRWPENDHEEFVNVGDRKIPLDKRFTIRSNMERFFKNSHRAKRGLVFAEQRKGEILAELSQLKDAPEGKGFKNTVAVQKVSARTNAPKNAAVFTSSDGYVLWRGKNAKGNAAILRAASPHDLWLHVETGPGAHVIIRRAHPADNPPERTLDEAGALAACKSWLASADNAGIMYAEARHVRPIRGSLGEVSIAKLAMTRVVHLDSGLEGKLMIKD